MQSSMRAGNEADRILNGSPDSDGKLGEVLERSSASRRIPLLPPPTPGPVLLLLLLLLPMDEVDDAATSSDDILRVLHSDLSNEGKIEFAFKRQLHSGGSGCRFHYQHKKK